MFAGTEEDNDDEEDNEDDDEEDNEDDDEKDNEDEDEEYNVNAICLYQTLSIWLGIQFRQRNGQIKDRKPKKLWNMFGLT